MGVCESFQIEVLEAWSMICCLVLSVVSVCRMRGDVGGKNIQCDGWCPFVLFVVSHKSNLLFPLPLKMSYSKLTPIAELSAQFAASYDAMQALNADDTCMSDSLCACVYPGSIDSDDNEPSSKSVDLLALRDEVTQNSPVLDYHVISPLPLSQSHHAEYFDIELQSTEQFKAQMNKILESLMESQRN
jgi:hypothetical protein